MNNHRRTARIAGIMYLITFVTSIPAVILYAPVLNNADFVLGNGSTTSVLWGAALEILLALSCIGTAVVLYPVVRRQHLGAALGFVTTRVLEASIIVSGIVSLLTVVTLRENLAAAATPDAATATALSDALVAFHNWTFLLGPGVIPAFNALLLGYLMYRSGLVPRWIPTAGLIGAPLLLTSASFTLFGVFEQGSSTAALLAVPIALWEFSLGIYLTFKGFKPEAAKTLEAKVA